MCVLTGDIEQLVPTLIRRLKQLTSAGFSPEHDVTGVTDPFLQIRILKLLRILGRGCAETSDQMTDVLTQVATNTDAAKNVGHAVLYEAVLTIMETESEQALRVLGVNLLGRFLGNSDNNIRYVALTTLNKTVGIDHAAVQRHRNTVLECLHDPDISIRRSALTLTFSLINESNVRVLIRELLAFLDVADAELKPGLCAQICLAADRFAPNPRWHLDTVLRVLRSAGCFVKEEQLSSIVALISRTPELQAYGVKKLFVSLEQLGPVDSGASLSAASVAAASEIDAIDSLWLVGLWCIGEYGDLLVSNDPSYLEDEQLVQPVTPPQVVKLVEATIKNSTSTIIKEYGLVCLLKLSSRYIALQETIRRIMVQLQSSSDLEVQQRAVEFPILLDNLNICKTVLDRIPAAEFKLPTSTSASVSGSTSSSTFKAKTLEKEKSPQNQMLLMLDDLITTTSSNDTASTAPVVGAKSSIGRDLLDDLFAAPLATTTPTPVAPPVTPATTTTPTATTNKAAPVDEFVAYDVHGLRILMKPQRDPQNAHLVHIRCTLQNYATGAELHQISLQVAVPKTMKQHLLPAPSTSLPSKQSMSQLLKISNPSNAPIKLRLRVAYEVAGGKKVVETTEFHGFPANL